MEIRTKRMKVASSHFLTGDLFIGRRSVTDFIPRRESSNACETAVVNVT